MTFGFPRTTQKPSRIVKENGHKNNITFTVRHVTNDLKMLPFRTLFFIHFDVFFEFWPRRTPVPSQSHKKDFKQEPRGCHELPRRSQKGATMSPGIVFLVKRRFPVCNFSQVVFRWLSRRPKYQQMSKITFPSIRNNAFLYHNRRILFQSPRPELAAGDWDPPHLVRGSRAC